MNWILRDICRGAVEPPSMRCPSNSTRPDVGAISRTSMRPVVDFPQPDSPTSDNVSPLPTSKLTPSTARSHLVGRPKKLRSIG